MNRVMGITYADKTDIVNFAWQQNDEAYAIDLFGPMHVGSAKITGNESAVTLWKSETEKVSAQSPETLIKHQIWLGASSVVHELLDTRPPRSFCTCD